MNRLKIVLGYILGFITSVLIATVTFLIIFKVTVFNKSYINKTLNKSSYVDMVYNQVSENMKNYMVSSGFPESIIDGAYTKEDIKSYVNLLVDDIYKGKVPDLDSSKVKENLYNNIDSYLKAHNVKVESKSSIDSFVNDMTNIYSKELKLYGALNSPVKAFYKVSQILDKAVFITTMLLVISIISILSLKIKYKGSIVLAGGLIMAFMIFLFYDKFDYNNILIISSSFSNIMKIIINKIRNISLVLCIFYSILGLLIIIKESFLKNTLKNKE